jgi:hypothetical protein
MPEHINLHSTPEQRAEWGRKAAERTAARHIDVDIDEVTFGVEIECFVKRDWASRMGIVAGNYHRDSQLPAPFPYGWNAQRDASLRPDDEVTYRAMEVVSPVLKGVAGLKQVVLVLNTLERAGAKVSATCGLHVHVGMPSLLGARASDFDLVASWVARLVALISRHEVALGAIGGTPTRFNNHYCQSVKDVWKHFHVWSKGNRAAQYQERGSRYRVLNVAHLFDSQRTVEFRVFAGTLNATKVVGYITTALGLCHKAADKARAVKFDDSTYTVEQLRLMDLQAQVAKLHKELQGYGWPTHEATEIPTLGLVKHNQLWNAGLTSRKLRGQ